jgi:hypothetical protein
MSTADFAAWDDAPPGAELLPNGGWVGYVPTTLASREVWKERWADIDRLIADGHWNRAKALPRLSRGARLERAAGG